jgi:hypothetical protein
MAPALDFQKPLMIIDRRPLNQLEKYWSKKKMPQIRWIPQIFKIF